MPPNEKGGSFESNSFPWLSVCPVWRTPLSHLFRFQSRSDVSSQQPSMMDSADMAFGITTLLASTPQPIIRVYTYWLFQTFEVRQSDLLGIAKKLAAHHKQVSTPTHRKHPCLQPTAPRGSRRADGQAVEAISERLP